jgi:hypothetical protein
MMLDIRNEIIKVLKNNFPDHKIYGEKVTQGLIRPCFFVDLIPVDIEEINPEMQERSMFVDIQYMSNEDTKAKNLETAETLSRIFTIVEFNNFRIRTTNKRFEIVDGILHYLFDLDFIVLGSQEENTPLIGEINLNKEVF